MISKYLAVNCLVVAGLPGLLFWILQWVVTGTLVVLAFLGTLATAAEEPDRGKIEFFEERIRPILAAHCYKCHSVGSEVIEGGLRLDDRAAIRRGGDSGQAIVPGNVEESLLLAAIQYDGNFYDMPPGGKLPEAVLADFRRWVEMGAPDPRNPEQEAASPPTKTAASPDDLWVLKPLRRPPIPTVSNHWWTRGPIDRFIAARLEAEKLKPADAADRYTLLRRVTYDLTGLPPTLAEIDAFAHDRSADAYETVVDRLLASPAFGEHWARHWFDLSCYADLGDVQGNIVLKGAWRFRDYVIDAFNSDKPFNQFIHEQIAGDLLPHESVEERREQLFATGFLAIGPWTLQNYVKPELEADVVDHQIDKISRTFLGMSLRCARCHDHKFDPIPTRDYYALAGIFHSTLTTRYDGPGVWSQIVSQQLPELPDDPLLKEYDERIAVIQKQHEELEAKKRKIESEDAPPESVDTKQMSATANSLTLEQAIAANETGTEYRVTFSAGPTVWNGSGQATGEDDGVLIQVLREDDTVVAQHDHLPGAWSSNAESQALSEVSFTYTGDGSGNVRLHLIASPRHTNRFGGAVGGLKVIEVESDGVLLSEGFNDFQPTAPPGVQTDTGLPVYAAGKIPGWSGGGINHTHAVDLGGKQEKNDFAVQLFGGQPGGSDDPRIQKIDEQLADLNLRLELLKYSRPELTHVLAVQDVESPDDAPIYVRGNFQTPGEVVPRGFLTALGEETFPPIPEQSSGRRELAEWLTADQNPVTPRVLANRVWHHLFGAGLVRSVDYFGIHGDTPSHPELLDYLAVQFREDHGWSLKQLVREIVLSSTYRMASSPNAAAVKVDPDNRLLWRMNRRRLTAESIRDGMLAISGKLDYGRGGPSLGLEIPGNVGGIGDQVNPPGYSGSKIPDDVAHRRAVYLPLFRSPPAGPLEILDVFDFPHPSEITGQRPERTVPTQALFLLNAPLVDEQARLAAERLLADLPPSEDVDDQARVRRLYLMVLNCPADELEVRQAIDYIHQCQQELAAGDKDAAAAQLAAWTDFCRALFASNAFLFRE